MLVKTCLFAASILLTIPVCGALKAQTLLETFVFIHNGGFINVDQLKERADGTLTEPESPYVSKGTANTWRIIDQRQCILQNDTPALQSSVTYYLSNVTPDYRVDVARSNVPRLNLYGDRPVVCLTERGQKSCNKRLSLEAAGPDLAFKVEKAVRYIFEKFCTLAKPDKPF